MGPLAVQTLFLKTLPDTMRAEIYKRPELKSLELMKLVDWARHQTVWERSEELASQMLKPEKVMQVVPQRQEPPEQLVAAVQPPPRPLGQRPGRDNRRQGAAARQPTGSPSGRGTRPPLSPFARDFKGCYHCGKEDHSRSPNPRTGRGGCEEFAVLLKQHNGLPQGCKGRSRGS